MTDVRGRLWAILLDDERDLFRDEDLSDVRALHGALDELCASCASEGYEERRKAEPAPAVLRSPVADREDVFELIEDAIDVGLKSEAPASIAKSVLSALDDHNLMVVENALTAPPVKMGTEAEVIHRLKTALTGRGFGPLGKDIAAKEALNELVSAGYLTMADEENE